MSTLTVGYTHPSDNTLPIKNTQVPPKTAAPPQKGDAEEYLCGDLSGYQGANPGRDQDRSRMDERVGASYIYPSQASGVEGENETGVTEGY